jgi:DNA-binding transcriptional LysR family regulator
VRLNQLRDFLAVVDAGSLRAAARALGVTQPAITKSIRQLENELHASLLQRNARGARVTRAGRAFLERARVIRAELRKAEDDLQRLRGGSKGSVAFGIAPAACTLIVPEALLQFRRQHPEADVRIVEGVNRALVPLVRDETLDFSVGQAPGGALDAALMFKPLFRPELTVVGRRGHPLRSARSLRDLAHASWLMFYPPGSGATLEKAFAAAGLPLPQPILQCESYAAAVALIAKTDMLGLLIRQVTEEFFGRNDLQAIPVSVPAPLIGMYLRSDTPLTPAAATMAHAVTSTARRLAREARSSRA